jgi:hypothetical protein
VSGTGPPTPPWKGDPQMSGRCSGRATDGPPHGTQGATSLSRSVTTNPGRHRTVTKVYYGPGDGNPFRALLGKLRQASRESRGEMKGNPQDTHKRHGQATAEM